MKRSARTAAGLLSALVGGGLAATASCTIFNHIELPLDAGLDAGAPPGDAPADGAIEASSSYLSREDAVRFCSNAIGCPYTALAASIVLALDIPFVATEAQRSQFSMCMHWATEVVRPDRVGFATQQAEMVNLASKILCERVQAEAPLDVIATPGVCAGLDAGSAVCSDAGSGVVLCGIGSALYAPCQPPQYTGTTCAAVGARSMGCVLEAGCGATPAYCDGEISHYCSLDGRAGTFNCGLTGRTCVAVAGATLCSSGAACASWRCDGQKLVSCLPELLEGPSFECPAGTTCTAFAYGGYCAPAAGSSCTPASGGDRCEGNTLHYCAGGKDTTADCDLVHLGWKCRADLGHPSATCAP